MLQRSLEVVLEVDIAIAWLMTSVLCRNIDRNRFYAKVQYHAVLHAFHPLQALFQDTELTSGVYSKYRAEINLISSF